MRNQKKNGRCMKVGLVVAGAALTVAGFVVIPPLVKKYSNKVYKKSLNTEDIDFDNMGPEIVPNKDTKGEEE
ncbi:MAG: hypothetical protein HXL46_08055 [Solobacterium sp.]|uniref:hypothetical protein n=1 Tax=Solobacterium sp. TaxID=2060878 RepID=UPI001CAEDB52|nr:hypothetical protein [Solobacterium sp.]MBF1089992.1 hypothetical protein [Solobacterium sp.]